MTWKAKRDHEHKNRSDGYSLEQRPKTDQKPLKKSKNIQNRLKTYSESIKNPFKMISIEQAMEICKKLIAVLLSFYKSLVTNYHTSKLNTYR